MTRIIFANAAEKAGWNPESQVEILLDYIENQNSDLALEDFLNEKIQEEKERGEETEL